MITWDWLLPQRLRAASEEKSQGGGACSLRAVAFWNIILRSVFEHVLND